MGTTRPRGSPVDYGLLVVSLLLVIVAAMVVFVLAVVMAITFGVARFVLAVVVSVAFGVTRWRFRGRCLGTAASGQGNESGHDQYGTGELKHVTNHQFPFSRNKGFWQFVLLPWFKSRLWLLGVGALAGQIMALLRSSHFCFLQFEFSVMLFDDPLPRLPPDSPKQRRAHEEFQQRAAD